MSAEDWWATAVSRVEPDVIEFRGYPVQELIGRASFAQVAALLVLGELPSPGRAALLEAALVAPADHGPQAPSIAAARMAATCGVGLNSAVATGVGMLGDTHGGAGQQCVALLHAMRAEVDAGRDVTEVAREVVADHRARRAFVPGFGHRFHRRDPRRDPLMGLVEDAVARGDVEGGFLACGLALEGALAEGRERPVPMNIDGATAVIYAELGCAPELARGFFVLSRSIGILAHAWEESGSGRRIKGPMAPPATAPYTGPDTRHLS
ncbi:citryl-CoA lyase [Desertihabitans aurantiacus]|uniref:citryl-CoA lyase n=1 Tax=Desertihabitans aurantiacus TaxID=2282477 RepID=UPI000DF761AA|nr:citryl-CoA lyase [Desertihabitans aurantiacus]